MQNAPERRSKPGTSSPTTTESVRDCSPDVLRRQLLPQENEIMKQHDWHVREWRMARSQAFLIYGLYSELRRFANMPIT